MKTLITQRWLPFTTVELRTKMGLITTHKKILGQLLGTGKKIGQQLNGTSPVMIPEITLMSQSPSHF